MVERSLQMHVEASVSSRAPSLVGSKGALLHGWRPGLVGIHAFWGRGHFEGLQFEEFGSLASP